MENVTVFPVAFTLPAFSRRHQVDVYVLPHCAGALKIKKLQITVLSITTEYSVNDDGSIDEPAPLFPRPLEYPRKPIRKKMENPSDSCTSAISGVEVVPHLPFLAQLNGTQSCSELVLLPGETKAIPFAFSNESDVTADHIELWLEENIIGQNKPLSSMLFSSSPLDIESSLHEPEGAAYIPRASQNNIKDALPVQRMGTLAFEVVVSPSLNTAGINLCLKYSTDRKAGAFRQILLPLQYQFQEGIDIMEFNVFNLHPEEICFVDQSALQDHQVPVLSSQVLFIAKTRNNSSEKMSLRISCKIGCSNYDDLESDEKEQVIACSVGPEKGWITVGPGEVYSLCAEMRKQRYEDLLTALQKMGVHRRLEDANSTCSSCPLLQKHKSREEAATSLLLSRVCVQWRLARRPGERGWEEEKRETASATGGAEKEEHRESRQRVGGRRRGAVFLPPRLIERLLESTGPSTPGHSPTLGHPPPGDAGFPGGLLLAPPLYLGWTAAPSASDHGSDAGLVRLDQGGIECNAFEFMEFQVHLMNRSDHPIQGINLSVSFKDKDGSIISPASDPASVMASSVMFCGILEIQIPQIEPGASRTHALRVAFRETGEFSALLACTASGGGDDGSGGGARSERAAGGSGPVDAAWDAAATPAPAPPTTAGGDGAGGGGRGGGGEEETSAATSWGAGAGAAGTISAAAPPGGATEVPRRVAFTTVPIRVAG